MNTTDKILLRKTWEVGQLLGVNLDLDKTGEYSYQLVDGEGARLSAYGRPVFTNEQANMGAETVMQVLQAMEFVAGLSAFNGRDW